MERATLEAMLQAADGIARDGNTYTSADAYMVSVYLGEPGQAMEVSDIATLRLHAGFCEVASREQHAVYFVEYSSLHGLAVRPPTGGGAAGRRAGFS